MTAGPLALHVRRISTLPPLAWFCRAEFSQSTLALTCGNGVETAASFFVEGCWAGDFSAGQLHRAEAVFGSGGAIDGERTVFVPCTATTDSLFFRQDDAGITVSNSLPFLLAATDDSLDAKYDQYDADNASITQGIDRYHRWVRTRRGKVRRLLHRNLVVAAGQVTEEDKPWPPAFGDYDAYCSHLERSVASLLANARHTARRQPLRVLTTQSRGYDSTAVNALAAPYGIDVAFTCATSKGAGHFADSDTRLQGNDDGSEIPRELGVACVIIDRRRFERPFANEHLYFAALDNPQDLNLLEINERIDGPSLLLTGALGELWYPVESAADHPGFRDPDLQRWDLGNHGMSEVRLRYGFVQAAIPFIGARRRSEIVEITESAAMLPWRIGGAYDRPIPRRIAESRAIPRSLFGQKKAASVVEFATPRVPITPALRLEYLQFLRDEGILGALGRALLPAVRKVNAWMTFHPARYYLERMRRVITRQPGDARLVLWQRLNGRVFCFAVNKCAAEYRRALGESSPAPTTAAPRPGESPPAPTTAAGHPMAGN